MKLGYTFYPRDWNTSEAVFELNLEERGLYRELIDLAMLNDNKTEIKLAVWTRKFGCDTNTLQTILNRLETLKLINKSICNKTLFIPSCETRLNLIRGARKGGLKSKPIPKPLPKPIGTKVNKTKLKESKKEDTIVKFLDWFNNQKLKHTNKKGSFKSLSTTDENNLKKLTKDYSPEDFNKAIPNLFASQWAKETNNQTPTHFLRVDNFNKFLNQDSNIAPAPVKTSLYD